MGDIFGYTFLWIVMGLMINRTAVRQYETDPEWSIFVVILWPIAAFIMICAILQRFAAWVSER